MKPTKTVVMFAISCLALLSAVESATAQKQKAVTAKSVSKKGNLSVEAGLVFKNGDVKPAARTEFFLLDVDLETVLQDAGLKTDQFTTKYSQRYASLVYMARELGAERIPSLGTTQQAIRNHSVATTTTDFNGKATFNSIKAGAYYLVGVGGTGKQVVIWNLPISVKSGNQSVTLDNNNASVIF